MTDYDKLVDLFYKRLAEQRQYNQVSTYLLLEFAYLGIELVSLIK